MSLLSPWSQVPSSKYIGVQISENIPWRLRMPWVLRPIDSHGYSCVIGTVRIILLRWSINYPDKLTRASLR